MELLYEHSQKTFPKNRFFKHAVAFATTLWMDGRGVLRVESQQCSLTQLILQSFTKENTKKGYSEDSI